MASPTAGVDYERQGASFQRTRGRTTGTAAYAAPVRRELGDAPPGWVIDVGSGTGVWSAALAAWSRRPVVAVEPAEGMRSVASAPRDPDADSPAAGGPDADASDEPATRGAAPSPGGGDGGRGRRVHLVGGRAGALPVRDGSGAAAWLSTVIHHVGELDRCARDLRRALAPGAPVLIRNAFPGRYEGIPMVRYFPGSRRALDGFPSVDAVRAAFTRAGFRFVGVEPVVERSIDLAAWRDVLPHQRLADTALVHLSDDEFAAGMRAMDDAIAAGRPPEPVALDLMVLRRL